MWGWNWLEQLWQDVRYALRGMRRSPGFTAVAVGSLALGIGANTAIFSLMNTVMLRMLPVQHPEQLVELLQKYPGEPRGNGYWTWPSYEHFRENNHVFSAMTGTSVDTQVNVRTEGSQPGIVVGEYVTGNFFPVLGLKPAIGRLIGPQDDPSAAAGAVAVVSWPFWNARFHLDPAILGKRIVVQDRPVTIIGVTPRAYFGLRAGSRTDVWLPRMPNASMGLYLLGRLKPGVTIEQVRAEMPVLYRFTLEERTRNSKDPLVRQLKAEVEPAGAGISPVRDRYGKPLILLMAVVGLLLLIACINLASMLLARAAGRQREMAVRVGLGAGRVRLVRQVLTESLLLSLPGALLGVLLAQIGTGVLVRIIASGREFERINLQVQTDHHVLVFTAGIALLTGLLFGLAPALYAFRSASASALRQTGGAGETLLRRLFGRGLVVAQVALSVLLLSAAGLFVGHLSQLKNLNLGFQRDHILLVTLDPARSGYKREQLSGPYQELLARLESIPGVRSASISGVTPIQGAGAANFVTAEGHQERPEDRRYVSYNLVAPKYFATLGTPLLAGRDFQFEDQGRPRVAIVNQAMARYYFGGANPIGKHVKLDGDDKPYEIVGVVGDAKYYELRETPPRTMYLNMFQEGRMYSQFVLRTGMAPASVAGEVRLTVREILKTVPVAKVITLADQVDASIVPERLIATLSGLFGALGALIAAIGLYGLLSYTVARRANEIGIRMALGATQSGMARMVLGEALGMICVGLAIGAPIAYWGQRFAANLIPDLAVKSAFPIVFGTVMMIALAVVAAYVPARRAARVDPMEALRYE
jgi:predicted permease